MTFSLYSMAIDTFVPMLRTLSTLLDKAAAHALDKKLDFAELAQARLAADMYPLSTQVQIACHQPLEFFARVTGGEPPRFEDGKTDGSLAALKAQIAMTIERLQSAPASKFEGVEDRLLVVPLGATGMILELPTHQLLRDWMLPHFYFHVVTAYDILRHHGVALGKADYISHVSHAIRKSE
jgi:hypothetical protein